MTSDDERGAEVALRKAALSRCRSTTADGHAPEVSVVVCTRDREQSLKDTILSLLRSNHGNFEVLVVDQSTQPDTARLVSSFSQDARIRYIRSTTSGNGAARNEGADAACGEILAYTDDDCEVPADWLNGMIRPFHQDPRIGLVYCTVDVGPHDEKLGFIPGYQREGSETIRTMWQKVRARGIGAGLAVRRSTLLEVGGFDALLGPGSKFHACVDGDLSVRAILHGWWVYETDDTHVVHHGFRTWEQGKSASHHAWYGIGAAYSKPLKAGRLSILPVILAELVISTMKPLKNLAKFRRPTGGSQPFFLVLGLVAGLFTRIDRESLRFTE
jgi:GT2 family glycosyltransferase